jgi:GT2 family glycosyltransferase
MPYFSIIMPPFNRAKEMTRAIQSCLTQGYGDYEIIVIDDGSTDGGLAGISDLTQDEMAVLPPAAKWPLAEMVRTTFFYCADRRPRPGTDRIAAIAQSKRRKS